MSRPAILVLIVVVAALFGVVWMASDDAETSNTPADRFEVPVPGGTKDVPAERQNPG